MRRLPLALGLLVLATPFDRPITQAQVTTPMSATAANGEVPSEAGMYLRTTDGFTKVLGQIVSFTRTGSLLVSKVTIGIKASKQNVQLLGPHAQTVASGRPIFYFIPPKQEADAGVNAGDFILIRLEEKPQRRQFEIGAEGAWRSSKGISITHQIQLIRSEAKPSTYSITPAVDLPKGEYALYLARGEGMQAYVYDFSVDLQLERTAAPNGTRPDANSQELRESGIKRLAAVPATSEATAEITSVPSGADVEIDGKFVGNTPSSVGLVSGEHTLRVSKSHYKSWERSLQVSTGEIRITAELEPSTGDQTTPVSSGAAATIVREPLPAISPEHASEEWIGISFTGIPTVRHNGLEVSGVRSKGPAEGIGVQVGDVILAIDGRFVYTIEEFRTLLTTHDRRAPVALRYRRDRLTYENSVSLALGKP
jgi:hypothetical protein